MGKITNLLIALILVAFIMASFIYYIADVGDNTGISFNESNYNATYNKIAEVNALSQDIVNTGNTSVEVSSNDILGSYFKQGYGAYRLTMESGEITGTMINDATNDLQLEDGSNTFKTMLMSIVAVIVILSIIVAVVVGKDV